MGQDDEDLPEAGVGQGGDPAAPRRRRLGRGIAAAILVLLTAALAWAWLTRERIADDLISRQLAQLDLPATYDIVSIGPRRQILRNIVVGDPARPDLTIERAEVSVGLDWGTPRIGSVKLVRPRLYGSYRKGKLSFGSLDPLLFTGGKEPFRLPDLDLAVADGRGLLETDFGPVGLKLVGSGPLRGGFKGEAAAVAPDVAVQDCQASGVSLYGSILVSHEKPRFVGPLRLRRLTCATQAVRLADAGIRIDVTADPRLDGAEGDVGLQTGAFSLGGNRMTDAKGTGRFTFRDRALTARYDLTGKNIETSQAAARSLRIEGVVRSADGLARVETEGNVDGAGLRLGRGLDQALAEVERGGRDTLAASLIARLRAALDREARSSTLDGSFVARRTGEQFSVVVPQATLRGGSGDSLVSLSRLQLSSTGTAFPRLVGNFATGGEGVPRIAGRIEQAAGGRIAVNASMAEYHAGDAMLAVPEFAARQRADGAFRFAGRARLSGALPGGHADALEFPIAGDWSSAGGLTLWRDCVTLRFDRLELANVVFGRQPLSLCPPRGTAILRSDARGTRIAAGAPSLDISGHIGETPIRIRSGPIGVAVPGTLAARQLDVTLGPAGTASHFRIANLDARIGNEVAGHFSKSDVFLASVPLDILDAQGEWRYAGGKLLLTDGQFRLEDRQVDDRFQPLVAHGAELRLADNLITADASLHEPQSDREIVRTTIRHDLATGGGNADLAVDGILFDKQLQPDTLTRLALGVIANASGRVRGSGRIDWNEKAVSSTGSFTTDGLDFAAAFGPVKGASGTIHFTDLLGMVTAPDQTLHVASINPGIEVNDGVITYALRPNNVLAVKGGRWPFLEGTLTLEPVTMNIGVAETRRYVLVIDGLDAARFVARMDMANLSATGTFDGRMPLVFDENGGRIEGGMLTSRPPGGNVAYVGELTYKDLSAMANFAFDALRSLDYREMTIGMDGALEGEIVTRVRFRGVSQGEGASSNFLTKRIARLPIQFNINLRAPFFQLLTSFKSLYDPAYVRDPRSLGLLDAEGEPVSQPQIKLPIPPAETDVQRRESETMQ